MSDTANDAIKKIIVMSIHQETGECFLKDVCAVSSGSTGAGELDGTHLSYKILAGEPAMTPDWEATAKDGDYHVLLCHYLDLLSLQKTKEIFFHLLGIGLLDQLQW